MPSNQTNRERQISLAAQVKPRSASDRDRRKNELLSERSAANSEPYLRLRPGIQQGNSNVFTTAVKAGITACTCQEKVSVSAARCSRGHCHLDDLVNCEQ